MKTEAIIKKIKELPGGRFFRVRYISKVKMAADALKEGVTIFKIVDTTTRTGVKYASLVDEPNEFLKDKVEKVSNWSWTVKDRIKHNNKTGKDYLVVAPIGKGAHTVTTYVLTAADGTTKTVDKDVVQQYAVASYWRDEKPKVMNITLENILMIK